MGRRLLAGASDRGGEDVQALRQARAPLAAALAATTLAAWLAAWPALLAHGDRAALVAAPGAAGLAALGAALAFGSPAGAAAGLALVGCGYALHLVLDEPPLDGRAAIVAAGLLTAGELAFWSLELRGEVVAEPGRMLRRLGLELALGVAGLLLAGLVLTAADLARVGGLATEAAGAAAAAALLALWLRSLHRGPP
ncbi:MAG TPA: hypothetical protein VFB26_11050 [Gaiellaceae bacterium]|nr:hypothetical protein [Gaiellaceae bacterium]